MKKTIWDNWLKADMRARYWGYLSKRYYNYDIFVKIFLAITTSGTVASWGIWKDVETLWKGLSCLSAVVSVAVPFLKFTDKIKKMANISREWTHIMDDYEVLWIKRKTEPEEEVMKEFQVIKSKEKHIDDFDALLPSKDETLLKKCQNEVLLSRGLIGGGK